MFKWKVFVLGLINEAVRHGVATITIRSMTLGIINENFGLGDVALCIIFI